MLPRLSDKLEDSCGNCINQYTPPTPYLKPDCTVSPLQVNYEHVKYYNGKVNCGNLFLEADIGGGINIPPTVIYPNDEINVDEYYTLIMVDPDADLADNGSWNYDSPNPTPGKVEKILKGRPKSIQSPSPSLKIQIMGGKVCLTVKAKHCWALKTNFVIDNIQCFAFTPFPPII